MSIFQIANASTVLQVDIDTLVNDSELVFEGEVVFAHSEMNTNGNIYTYVDFLVLDILIGSAEIDRILTLRFTGGVVGDMQLDVGVTFPAMGEHGIYFVESTTKKLANPLLGWSQGHFRISADGQVTAGENQAVVSIEHSLQKQENRISNGVARGVVTSSPSVNPLSTKDFKELIKQLKN